MAEIEHGWTAKLTHEFQTFYITVERPIDIGTLNLDPQITAAQQVVRFYVRAHEIKSQKLDLESRLTNNATFITNYYTKGAETLQDHRTLSNIDDGFSGLDKDLTLILSLTDLALVAVRKAIGFSGMRFINSLPVPESIRSKIECPQFFTRNN